MRGQRRRFDVASKPGQLNVKIIASKKEVGADVITQVDGDTEELQHTDMHTFSTAEKAETQSKLEYSMHM